MCRSLANSKRSGRRALPEIETAVDVLPRVEAYVEQLKEQALAKLPKNPPPPSLTMQSVAQDSQ